MNTLNHVRHPKLFVNLYEIREKFHAKVNNQGHWPFEAKKEVKELFETILANCEHTLPEKKTINRKLLFTLNKPKNTSL